MEIEQTRNRMLHVWWSLIWRLWAYGLLAMGLGAVLALIMGAMGVSPEQAPLFGPPLGIVIWFVASYRVVKRIFALDFDDFRLGLISNDSERSFSGERKQGMPFGMKMTVAFLVLSILAVFLSWWYPSIVIGPWVMRGTPLWIYLMLVAVWSGFCIYGILKRRQWARQLTVALYFGGIVLAWFNYLGFFFNPETVTHHFQLVAPTVQSFSTLTSTVRWLLRTAIMISLFSGILIAYLWRKRAFFCTAEESDGEECCV